MPLVRALAALVGVAAALVGAVLAAGTAASLVIAARIESQFQPAGTFVDIPGGRIAAIEAGPREGARGSVVLVHGASGNAADLMESVGRRLADQGFRVIAFDRPGLGWSDRIAGLEAATPQAQAAILAQALERMQVGPAIVVGHSWGGALALAMALDHPERVAAVALVSPVARPFPERERHLPWYGRLAIQPPVAWLLSRTLGPPAGLYMLSGAEKAAFSPQPPSERYLERSRAALVLRPSALLANLQDLVALPAALARQAPRYPSLRLPVTIVAGEADPIVRSEAQGVMLAREIPNARLVLLPGLGHMVPWVASERLAEEIGRLATEASAPAVAP